MQLHQFVTQSASPFKLLLAALFPLLAIGADLKHGPHYFREIGGGIHDLRAVYAWESERFSISQNLPKYPTGSAMRKDWDRRRAVNNQQAGAHAKYIVRGLPMETRPEGLLVKLTTGSKTVLIRNSVGSSPYIVIPIGPVRVGNAVLDGYDYGKPVAPPKPKK